MAIVRCRNLQPGSRGNFENVRNDLALFFQTVVVDFQNEAVLTENIRVLAGRALRLLEATLQEIRGDFAVEAGRKPDQPFAVLR